MNTIALVLILFKNFYFLGYNFQFIQEDERAKSSKKVKKAENIKRKRFLEDEEDEDYVISENEEENEDSEAESKAESEAEVKKIRGKVNKKVKEAQKQDKKIAKQAEDAAKSSKNYYDSFKNDKMIKTQLAYKEVT